MSAAEAVTPPATEIELRLEPTREYRRLLLIQMSASRRSLYIQLYARSNPTGPMLAFAIGGATVTRLCYGERAISLWCDRTAFDISAAEAQRIEETFAPHGLKVEQKGAAS